MQTNQNQKNDEFIFVEEAAKILNLVASTIYTYVRERRIPFYKPGKHLLFNRQELLDWLTNQRKGNQEDVQAISRDISGDLNLRGNESRRLSPRCSKLSGLSVCRTLIISLHDTILSEQLNPK